MAKPETTTDEPGTRDEQRMWHQQWSHYQPELDIVRPLFERWLRPLSLSDLEGLEVLDAGCGNGGHTAIMAQAGAKRVTGLDYASWREAERRFAHLGNVSFGFHDLGAGPPDGQYDLVVCVGVLPHVAEPVRAVTNWVRAAGLDVAVHLSEDGKSRTWIGQRAGG